MWKNVIYIKDVQKRKEKKILELQQPTIKRDLYIKKSKRSFIFEITNIKTLKKS